MKSESPLMPSILVSSHIIYRISYCLTDEQVESVVWQFLIKWTLSVLLLIESYKLDRFFKYILHLTFYSVCLLDPSAPYKHRVCLPRIEWLHRHHAPAHSNTLHLRLVCMYLCKSKLPPPKDLHTHTHTHSRLSNAWGQLLCWNSVAGRA